MSLNPTTQLGNIVSLFENTVRHCKVVATIGPSSQDEQILRQMIARGLNVVRLNFSHGDHEAHLRTVTTIRRLAEEVGSPLTIMQDLQGPKIRCGILTNDMHLKSGEIYQLIYGDQQNDPSSIPIDYPGISRDLAVGQKVLMNDGLLAMEIVAINEQSIEVKVTDGGLLQSRKGVNFPNANLSMSALTEKDNEDLLFGISNGVDVVALSFVQRADDVVQVKKMVSALASDVPIIAKIERISAVEDIDAIAAVSDGLMVARGDLGVEARVEKVPLYQRQIIEAAALHGKPVIVATQMLESMISNPLASLAEVADVANAVLETADCLMLSGETASGKYPLQALNKITSVIEEVENWVVTHRRLFTNSFRRPRTEKSAWEIHESIAIAACEAADSLGAKAIVCLTLAGSIAASIAKWRPRTPIIAISPRREVIRRLNLLWGVYAMQNPLFYKTDSLLQNLPQTLKNLKLVQSGDTIVITGGIPIAQMCPTNMVKINRIT